ncbi:T9SS type A sorting domain-containing protein [Salibacter halophilus]|uniref:T9SS type A sorting domain-containing protein n=1 Tax=Salibacter halophilus TaxID=1803916 RepID=A0A6N6M7V2_9FLAO|nr:T9SS type A sorting domain-containing protein [Salibacter halophilus]KAB1064728.1 T9SS type A sorting domain-containing protein [Salibacter halophilus]
MKKASIQLLLLLQVFSAVAQIRVTDIDTAGSSAPAYLRAIGNQLFFSANSASLGIEPYVLDTAGNVQLIGDIRPSGNSRAFGFTKLNSVVCFLASPSNGNTELYRYNSGTLHKVNAFGAQNTYRTNDDEQLTNYNNQLVFAYDDNSVTFGEELFKYDGFSSSIVGIQNINTGFFGSFPSDFIEMNNVLYFSALTQSNGLEIWSYNGGTASRRTDIVPGSANGLPSTSGILTPRFKLFQNELYFAGNTGTNGLVALHRYNGSGAAQLIPINNKKFKQLHSFYEVNNKLVFTGLDSNFHQQLYTYDGVNPVVAVSDTTIGQAIKFKDRLLFIRTDSINGYELWEYDGITRPELVSDINPGAASSISRSSFMKKKRYAVLDGLFYFTADNGFDGPELYAYDGTSTPWLVSDVNPGSEGSNPSDFEVFNNKLYFAADDGIHGAEIWKLNPIQVSVEEQTAVQFKMYPNPAQNIIQIDSYQEIDKLEIVDIMGRSFLQIENPGRKVDISHVKNGSYYLSVYSKGRRKGSKLLIINK